MLPNTVSQRNLLSLPAELRQQIFYEVLRPEEDLDISISTKRGTFLCGQLRSIEIRLAKLEISMQRTTIENTSLSLRVSYLSLYDDIPYVLCDDIQYVLELWKRENDKLSVKLNKLIEQDELGDRGT